MKKYEKPVLEVIELQAHDIILSSVETTTTEEIQYPGGDIYDPGKNASFGITPHIPAA